MDATVDVNNNVARGLEAEAEPAGGMEVEVSDTLEVKREYNKQVPSFTRSFCTVPSAEPPPPMCSRMQVALPILVVDYDSPTHPIHAPHSNDMIGTEHWIPPTPYNARYENCNSVLMPRRRASSSFFDSSSLPDLSTSLSIAASGGSGSPIMQKNPPEHLIDEEPIGVDEGKLEESSEDYEELRSWLDCVAISGEVARMRRADRLAPRLSGYGIEGLGDIMGLRKGSWSTSWYQGAWPPAAAPSTCAPEVQENVLPDEETPVGKEQRDASRHPSDHSGFIAKSTFAELQSPILPSASEPATTGAVTDAAPALLFEDLATSAANSKPSPDPPAHNSNSPVRRPFLRSSFATSHRNTIVLKKQKPGFVLGFKRNASQSFRKLFQVFGVRQKPTTVQSRDI